MKIMNKPAAASVDVFEGVKTRLKKVGQEHLLRFYDELNEDQRGNLLRQIAGLDLESMPRLVEEYVLRKPVFALPPNCQPAEYYSAESSGKDGGRRWEKERFCKTGQELIRAGKVAAFTVAGGQGSRLGYEGPKGCYPAGAVSDKPLFEIFADGLIGVQRRYGSVIPWYIMTSPLNHEQTVEFFRVNRYFGLEEKNVRFFAQGVLPSMDMRTGKILLSEKGVVATNPDGHGGSLRALHASGSIADMKRRGIEHLSYFQVDNPIVNVIDPVFIGLHAGAGDSSGEMSSKMVAKRDAGEKVGVFCRHGSGSRAGRTEVIEYSDLPRELSEQRNADGSLRFCGGSIAVHVMSVEFVERLNTDPSFRLPMHRAEKKIPHVDLETGESVNPSENNGVKLEAFVFDALPMCRRSIVLETLRVEEFAPIKNATGSDSPESSRRIQTERAARWLEELGVKVPRDAQGEAECVLEVDARAGSNAREIKEMLGAKLPKEIVRGAKMILG